MDKDIRCESYLWVQGIQTSTEDLTPTQREALAIWLKKEYLNELCRGKSWPTWKRRTPQTFNKVSSSRKRERQFYHDTLV